MFDGNLLQLAKMQQQERLEEVERDHYIRRLLAGESDPEPGDRVPYLRPHRRLRFDLGSLLVVRGRRPKIR